VPVAKIHILEGQYNTDRLDKVSAAIQAALMNTLGVPAEDFYQLVFEFPRARFRHTPSSVGMHYSDDLIILELTFIEGWPLATRLALLKINACVAGEAQISPDDLVITLYEAPGVNFSFGQGEAQQAGVVPRDPMARPAKSVKKEAN
jgi:4-oxalocrotonate tautomerase